MTRLNLTINLFVKTSLVVSLSSYMISFLILRVTEYIRDNDDMKMDQFAMTVQTQMLQHLC
jgi:hypothetical protein